MRKYNVPPIPQSIWKNPWHFIAFGFGTGALPFAPGTFGTLIAIPFYLVLQMFSVSIYFLILMGIILGSIWICRQVSKEIGIEDHQGMCLDEVVGYLVAMFAAPRGVLWIFLGVIFFRFLDIVKPWPINFIDEKLKGGAGMILDDVMAGIYTLILLHLLHWIGL